MACQGTQIRLGDTLWYCTPANCEDCGNVSPVLSTLLIFREMPELGIFMQRSSMLSVGIINLKYCKIIQTKLQNACGFMDAPF